MATDEGKGPGEPIDPGDPAEGNRAGELRIIIDDEGNVTLSDLPEELEGLVRQLTDDEALISRFCPLPDDDAV
jgi:hypothetical protein